ncbi:sugar transferase [Adlercreutzia sp. ZJ305]|uniref:sugar transferase n=1 Tax=Adlercreutzia sp. ZJ305 TaxID=2709408 RepID=UPI001F151408|nr:sugar transferase [Adlercreutzia sp. ZJ305]
MIKRGIDFLVSLLALPLVFLVVVVSAVAIKLDDGGPVFYKARRIGFNGRIFDMYKIRSMRVNAPDVRLADGSTYNSADDDRVTKFGGFARKTSLDEIPQLLNVLKGDMALIGPRPDSAFYLDHYTPEERVILTVRPGISGYNQAVNRNSVGTKEKLANDILYVENISFSFDVKIIAWTVKTVLASRNVYRSEE